MFPYEKLNTYKVSQGLHQAHKENQQWAPSHQSVLQEPLPRFPDKFQNLHNKRSKYHDNPNRNIYHQKNMALVPAGPESKIRGLTVDNSEVYIA